MNIQESCNSMAWKTFACGLLGRRIQSATHLFARDLTITIKCSIVKSSVMIFISFSISTNLIRQDHSINFEPSSIFLHPIWLLATVATLFQKKNTQTSDCIQNMNKGSQMRIKYKNMHAEKSTNKMATSNRRTPLNM